MLKIRTVIMALVAATGIAAGDTAPSWIVLKVGRVQVQPDKADGSPWDLQKQNAPDGCPAVGVIAAIAFGPSATPVATYLCSASSSTKQRERDPQAPDLFVQVKIDETSFRTAIAPDTFAESFDFPIVIPLDAVPSSGLELRVNDMDRDVNAGELMGLTRLTKQQILEAIAANTPLITLSDDRVTKLEVEINQYVAPREQTPFTFSVNKEPALTSVFARAGELVKITARGRYGVRSDKSDLVDPSGYANGQKSTYNRKNFERSNHAGAIAYIGAPTELHASLFVGTCVFAISTVPGRIYVGVNDTDLGNNSGTIEFTAKASLPTVDEWRVGGKTSCNEPPNESSEFQSAASKFEDSSLTPDVVLAKIQAAYFAGVKRCYKQYLSSHPDAKGKVLLSLTVRETGRVTGAARGFAPEVDSCISGQMSSWRFPIPKNASGDPVQTSLTLSLQLAPE